MTISENNGEISCSRPTDPSDNTYCFFKALFFGRLIQSAGVTRPYYYFVSQSADKLEELGEWLLKQAPKEQHYIGHTKELPGHDGLYYRALPKSPFLSGGLQNKIALLHVDGLDQVLKAEASTKQQPGLHNQPK